MITQMRSSRIEVSPVLGSTFQRWTGACSGSYRVCVLPRDADHTVGAVFAPITANLIFVASTPVPGAFGIQGVDVVCKNAASAANLAGTWRTLVAVDSAGLLGRLAWTSDDARTARGFVRMDGEIVADTAEDLVRDHRVRYPVLYEELGRETSGLAFTGALGDGTMSGAHCTSWTSTVGIASAGAVGGGPTLPNASSLACGEAQAVMCDAVSYATRWIFIMLVLSPEPMGIASVITT